MTEREAREVILARLRAQYREVPHPAAWRSRRHFGDLTRRFESSLRLVGGEPRRAPSLTKALDVLDKYFHEVDARRVIVNPDPPLDTVDFPARWPDMDWYVVGRTAGDARNFAAVADIGISSGTAALAETGTVVIESGYAHSRMAVLLPPVHIVLIPTERLTTDLFTWVAGRSRPFPAALTLITGPSKTADIEQTLAIGVHGPGRFIVILVDAWL